MVEAPAHYVKKLGFDTDSNGTNVNGVTRLLVLKSKKYGGLSAVLMHIHGAAGVAIDKVHYMDIPVSFTGNVFFTSLQGAFKNGYIYKNGKIIMVSAGRKNTTKPTGPQILVEASITCEIIRIDFESRWCDSNGGNCTPWVYDHSETYTYCTEGVPSPGGGNPGGGGTVAPSECTQGSGIETTSVNGKLVVRFYDGGDDGSGHNPCVLLPADTIVKKSLTDVPKAYCIYQKLVNNAAFKSLINSFTSSGAYTLTFNVGKLVIPSSRGETSTRADYSDPLVEITLNIDKVNDMSAASMAEVFIHEAYHAYIDQILIQHNRLTKIGFNNTLDSDFDRYVAFKVDSVQQAYLGQGINQSDPRWGEIQHEVIAQDIDRMANGLKDFVELIYPSAKTDPDYTFSKYQAYAWQGLIYSQAFAEKWGDITNPTYNMKNLLDQVPNPCSQ